MKETSMDVLLTAAFYLAFTWQILQEVTELQGAASSLDTLSLYRQRFLTRQVRRYR